MDKIAHYWDDYEDDMDGEDDDLIMFADTIAVVECDGDCAAHIVFHDEDGTIFAEAAISHQMAAELGEVFAKLSKGEEQAAPRRLHA